MNDKKRPADFPDATPERSKKPKIETLRSGVALPQKQWYDPWNSSSTGHQRAENNLAGSTSWRDSRNLKLGAQYKGGRGGGKRVADTVGAGSEEWGKDGRKVNGDWRKGASGLREKSQMSLVECVEGKSESKEERTTAATSETSVKDDENLEKAIAASLQRQQGEPEDQDDEEIAAAIAASLEHTKALTTGQDDTGEDDLKDIPPPSHQIPAILPCTDAEPPDDPIISSDNPKQIFHNLVFYINGSTAPLISDHRLKHLIVHYGGTFSISHMRKQVTHVIIGNPHNHLSRGNGAGGALAGTKIQKEILRHRGKGVKFVSADWVVESVKAGKRLGEAKFANVNVGGAGQGSVFEKFRKDKKEGRKDDWDDMDD